jgi:hypothetical protein
MGEEGGGGRSRTDKTHLLLKTKAIEHIEECFRIRSFTKTNELEDPESAIANVRESQRTAKRDQKMLMKTVEKDVSFHRQDAEGGGSPDILRKGGPLHAVRLELEHFIRCSVERGQVRTLACTFTQTTSQARVKGKS